MSARPNSETVARVCAVVADLFSVPEDELSGASSPATVPAWDSMGQLNLILEIEQQFGIEMSQERVMRITDIDSIAEIIDSAAA